MSETEQDRRERIFRMADQFIAIANGLLKEEDVGMVGASIRYAAARFAAHEASSKSEDLTKEKDDALDWFVEQYRKMLIENLDEHIERQKRGRGHDA